MSPVCLTPCIIAINTTTRSTTTFMQIWGSLACGRTSAHGATWAFPSTVACHCMPDTPIVARLATRVAFACCSVVRDNYGLLYAANLHFS